MTGTFHSGRALLIGIGEGYPLRMRLPRVVRADAEVLARVLEDGALCGYPKENLEVLLDEQATKANILAGLNRLAATATVDDTVLVFFSGHGARCSARGNEATYICPVDFDPSSPRTTGIESEDLSALIKSIAAPRVVVVLDACHSDGATFLKAYGEEKQINFSFKDVGLERLAVGAGRVVISSCKEDESSYTYNQKGHSLFTFFLLEGLRGGAIDRGDGLVHVLDLFHYVSEQVPKHASSGNEQHPVVKVHAENNFALALRSGGVIKGGSAQSALVAGPSVELRRLEKLLSALYPTGPQHNDLWSRAGGDVSLLNQAASGRAGWHSAIRMLSLGGGGQFITLSNLLETAIEEFPHNTELASLRG